MATDKNGNELKPGMRVLVLALVEDIPAVGPVTLKLGNGESPAANVAVHGNHIIIHPDEPRRRPAPILEADKDVMLPGNRRSLLTPEQRKGTETVEQQFARTNIGNRHEPTAGHVTEVRDGKIIVTRGAARPTPPVGWLESQEAKRIAASKVTSPGGSDDSLASRAPNDPNNAGKIRSAKGGDSEGSASTPHLTKDNQPVVAPKDIPPSGKGTL